MPYADPEQRREANLRYKAARRVELAAKERMRVARLKEADLAAWREKERTASQRFRESHKDDPAYREASRESARRYWDKVKDDPAIKQKNVQRAAAWYVENIDRAKANAKRAHKVRMKTDLQYKIKAALKRRMHEAIQSKGHKLNAVSGLGCSISELISHLERLFQPGMSWENWTRAGWHIDHVRPLKSYDLTDPAQYLEACHYTNLQPLWAGDNIRKGIRERNWMPDTLASPSPT